MSSARTVLAPIGVVTFCVLIVSTGGISSLLATHSVDVVATEPQHAYLGVEQTSLQPTTTTTDLEVTVTNQFPTGIVLTTVELTINGTTVDIAEHSRLEPGDSSTHTFRSISCDRTLTVTSASTDTRVQVERSVACS